MEFKTTIMQPLDQTHLLLSHPVLKCNVIVCFTGDTTFLFLIKNIKSHSDMVTLYQTAENVNFLQNIECIN